MQIKQKKDLKKHSFEERFLFLEKNIGGFVFFMQSKLFKINVLHSVIYTGTFILTIKCKIKYQVKNNICCVPIAIKYTVQLHVREYQ